MVGTNWRSTGINQKKDPQSVSAGPAIINPLHPGLSVGTGVAVRILLSAASAEKLRRDGDKIYNAVKPLLTLMVIFGLTPTRVRFNPPGGGVGIALELGEDISPLAAPSDYTALENNLNEPFNLPFISAGIGFEVQYTSPEMPFYAPRILKNWAARFSDPESGVSADVKNADDLDSTALIWDLSSSGAADLDTLCDSLMEDGTPGGPVRQFIDEALAEFELEAQQRAETHLYSIGLSGLIYDPDTWLHLFRWHESPQRRRIRIGMVRTIGMLNWRALTGPVAGGNATLTGNATDGPAKVHAFLREEIYGREVLTDSGPAWRHVSLLERIEDGLEQERIEPELVDPESISDWGKRRGKSKALLGKMARILARDHRKILEFDDDMASKPPPPEAGQIQAMSVLSFIDLMVRSNFMRYESAEFVLPPGVSMDGLEARSAEIIPIQLNVQIFPVYWQINREKAKALLVKIERDLLIVYCVLNRNSLDTTESSWFMHNLVTANVLRDRMELARGQPPYYPSPFPDEIAVQMGFPESGDSSSAEPVRMFKALMDVHAFRTTLEQAGPVTEGLGLIRKAAREARLLYERSTDPDDADIHDAWLAMGAAVVSADRFFEAGHDTGNVAILIERFLAGFAEGAGFGETEATDSGLLDPDAPSASEKLNELMEKHLNAIPYQAMFPQVFSAGIVYGMGEYLAQMAGTLGNFLENPYDALNDMVKAVELLLSTPTGDLFFELGKGMGYQAISEVERLNTYTNPFGYLFQIGRLLGPLVMEEIISMVFEGFVLAPLLSFGQRAMRSALRMGPSGYLDDLAMDMVQRGRLAPDVSPDLRDLVETRVALRAELDMELEVFVDEVLDAEGFFDAPVTNITALQPLDDRMTARGLFDTETAWIRHLYSQWQERIFYHMNDDLLENVAAAIPDLWESSP